ncbi:uncharacterized protein TNCV_143611 [Trichonephila clavipes]|nr:uncharacterized protein TNCV_143611 [Trichonephila clavipes]
MVERFLPTSQKEQRRAWGIFRRYPTSDNLIAFKRAKALARRIRRQCQRILDPVCFFNHIVKYQPTVMEKVKAANGLYRDFNIPILETSTALYSSPLDVANLIGKTFASVSSSDSFTNPGNLVIRYLFSALFLAIKVSFSSFPVKITDLHCWTMNIVPT